MVDSDIFSDDEAFRPDRVAAGSCGLTTLGGILA